MPGFSYKNVYRYNQIYYHPRGQRHSIILQSSKYHLARNTVALVPSNYFKVCFFLRKNIHTHTGITKNYSKQHFAAYAISRAFPSQILAESGNGKIMQFYWFLTLSAVESASHLFHG